MKHKDAKGFTLIELLVVIVILGILSTISVGTFRSYFAKARDAERLSAVATLTELIRADSGARGDCGLYNYIDTVSGQTIETFVDSGVDCDKGGDLVTLLIDNDYDMPEIKKEMAYYYGFKLGTQEGRNDFFIAVAAEEEMPQNAINLGDADNPLYLFADGTSDAVSGLAPATVGNTSGCDMRSDKTIICDDEWTLYRYGEDDIGDIDWGYVDSAGTGGGDDGGSFDDGGGLK